MGRWTFIGIALVIAASGVVAVFGDAGKATLVAAGGFDQFGYNHTARIFNGTGTSWCVAGGQPANCMGAYSGDKVVMKWTSDWDRGNDENWANPPYSSAWLDNEWDGKGIKGGSGTVWHFKTKWIGSCGINGTPLPDGGYCIWGQFEMIMDQGVDPSVGPGHLWYAKALSNGYGIKQI